MYTMVYVYYMHDILDHVKLYLYSSKQMNSISTNIRPGRIHHPNPYHHFYISGVNANV